MDTQPVETRQGAERTSATVGPTIGEPDEATSVFVRARPRPLKIAYQILRDASEAEDVVQEAWLQWQSTDRTVVMNPPMNGATESWNRANEELARAHEVQRQMRRTQYVMTVVDPGPNPYPHGHPMTSTRCGHPRLLTPGPGDVRHGRRVALPGALGAVPLRRPDLRTRLPGVPPIYPWAVPPLRRGPVRRLPGRVPSTQRTAQQHLAASLLRRAGEKRDSGDELGAVGMEAAADMVGATCPHCGGDLLGAFPVDGREVDRPPPT